MTTSDLSCTVLGDRAIAGEDDPAAATLSEPAEDSCCRAVSSERSRSTLNRLNRRIDIGRKPERDWAGDVVGVEGSASSTSAWTEAST